LCNPDNNKQYGYCKSDGSDYLWFDCSSDQICENGDCIDDPQGSKKALASSLKADNVPCTYDIECQSGYCYNTCLSSEEISNFNPTSIQQTDSYFESDEFRQQHPNIYAYIKYRGCGPITTYGAYKFIYPGSNLSLSRFFDYYDPSYNPHLKYDKYGYPNQEVDLTATGTNMREVRTVMKELTDNLPEELGTYNTTNVYGTLQTYYTQDNLTNNIEIMNRFSQNVSDPIFIISGHFCPNDATHCSPHITYITQTESYRTGDDGGSIIVIGSDSYFSQIDPSGNINQKWLLTSDPNVCLHPEEFKDQEYYGHACIDEFFVVTKYVDPDRHYE
jgi:hypothetical protein